MFLCQPLRLRRGVVIDAGHQHHLRAVAAGGLHLADGRPGGHADHRLDPQPGCGQGNALGVVPRRAGDDAPGRLLRRQAADLVVGAPELEGPGQLQVFRLDVHVLPKFRGPVQRCPPGDAPQGLLGLSDHIQMHNSSNVFHSMTSFLQFVFMQRTSIFSPRAARRSSACCGTESFQFISIQIFRKLL